MHHVPFSLKRGHLTMMRLLGPIAAPHDLTPARFDLLYVLATGARARVITFQCALAKRLGVTQATICKLVRALVRDGILEKHVYPLDRRCRVLVLTRYGRRCFRRLAKVRRHGIVPAELRHALRTLLLPKIEATMMLARLTGKVFRLCRGLDDHTTLYW